MPGWTDHYNALMENLTVEQEALTAQPFVCEFPTPHFYPGLAEEELSLSEKIFTEAIPLHNVGHECNDCRQWAYTNFWSQGKIYCGLCWTRRRTSSTRLG